MSDDTTIAEDTETESAEPVEPAKGDDWEAKYKEMQKHSREWEKRAKDAAPAVKKLAELEEAQKTELEKAQARADAAEKSAADAAVTALRAQVALDKKLTPSQAKRLVGSTQEELEADADELLADLKNTAPGSAPSSEGQGKQGEAVGQTTKQITSRDELKSMSPQEITQAKKDGRLDGLMGRK